MLRFLAWRVAQSIPTIVGITLITFAVAHLVPGAAPGTGEGELGASRASALEFRRAMGLDRPLAEQYVGWLGRLARLDLGRSSRDGRPVAERIAEAASTTAALALLALALIVAVGVPAGVHAATHPDSSVERTLRATLVLLHSLPNFWLAVMLLALVGAGPASHWLLPVIALAVGSLAVVARQVRGSVREALEAGYVRNALALGISPRRVRWRHALPNAALPTINTIGSLVPHLLGGSVVVETVFGIPGLGLLGYQAVATRDYEMIMGLTLLGALIVALSNLAVDLLSMWLDPRLAHAPAA